MKLSLAKAMRSEFIDAIKVNQRSFGISLTTETTERLADHYELIQEHNPILHLVAPCGPEEFAIRHTLESLVLLKFLPDDACFADVGPGGGFPSIPCLIVRPDLRAVLIESKEKKAEYLHAALKELGIGSRGSVIARQFAEVARPEEVGFVTSRALDRFTQHLAKLVKWSAKSRLLLFGGPRLGDDMNDLGINFSAELIPASQRRYLFVSK